MNNLERLGRFEQWLEGNPGRHLAHLEATEIARLLSDRYFPVTVQFGAQGANALQSVTSGRKIHLAVPGCGGTGVVASDFVSLPFGQRSVDLALLLHTLDFVDDPHALLRELTEAMVPDGHIVVVGFQPFSIWGARKWLRFPSETLPWCGHFFSTSRIQDWLSLMGYRVRAGKMLMYRPPLARQKLFERLKFMEKAGDRWWPMFGAVYIIHAQLETMRMIPAAAARKRSRFRSRLSQPAVRRVHLPDQSRKQ
jgi:SAM-dependent methyltransferase